jgi:carbamoyltransferase
MITWGISANSHNAAVAVFSDDRLVFASETERWSGIKNDPHLDANMHYYLHTKSLTPSEIVWYEKPLLKTLRQFEAGQGFKFKENNIRRYIKDRLFSFLPVSYVSHHHAHAAAGYYTSKFGDACVLVIDAIGEYDTLTIWKGQGNSLTKVYSLEYPNSLGLWYSAMTQRCGLKPNEEEYILMGMAAYGDSKKYFNRVLLDFFYFPNDDYNHIFRLKQNLHKGCTSWAPELTTEQDMFDIAAATQAVYELVFERVLQHALQLVPSRNLVFMGGCALNCSANPIAYKYFDNMWIMPAPGDSGSAIGAVLAKLGKHIEWKGPYLGYDMGSRRSNNNILNELLTTGVCGVARGPAEFGPRALGNRSLLADPRSLKIKEQVNDIKQRQQFRPFAPAILAELAHHYFDIPGNGSSPYMQVVARCRNPELFPAIVHADGSSRVQTVSRVDNPEFYELLVMWYKSTGCPMLLNTSLNIKGKPLVNDRKDCDEWEKTYGVRIFS